ncbi:MAG: choice-of-anchor L domain-containing protein [Tannerella sp.]|jgi:hypothetical protein|nr:choice-of-anchor L domain-containing protein [Tannerella sp.]
MKKFILACMTGTCIFLCVEYSHASVPVKKDTTSRKHSGIELRNAYDDPILGGPSAAYQPVRPATPITGSIWVDRNTAIHNYTPTDLVRRILLSSNTPMDQQRIQNVEHSGWNWNETGKQWQSVARVPDNNVWGKAANPGQPGQGGVVATYAPDERSLVYFENGGNAGFEFDKGLLMGTGPVLMAEGPNVTNHGMNDGMTNHNATHPSLQGRNTMHGVEEFGSGTYFNPTLLPGSGIYYRKHEPNGPWNPNQSFDRDLDALTQDGVMWTTVGSTLEFDFQPAVGKATFDYVFASDEYPEGVYSANDIFGFFVTGPYDSPPGSDIESTSASPTLANPTTLTEHTYSDSVYYRYNIARLPDNNPVGIDYVNWGIPTAMYTLTMTTNPFSVTTPAHYHDARLDTMSYAYAAATYRSTSGYDPTPGTATQFNIANSVMGTTYYHIPTNPHLFRYNHVGENMMEYDGFTVKLQAVADKLIPGKWYHLKLGVAQTVQKDNTTSYVLDNNHGSAVFLTNLELGTVNGNLNTPYMKTSFDNLGVDNNGNQFLYEGCDECVMTLKFDSIAAENRSTVEITYININSSAVQDVDGRKLFSQYTTQVDSIMLTGKSDTLRHYGFKLSTDYPGYENGQYVGIIIRIPGGGIDTVFYSPLYRHAVYTPEYKAPTTNYAGKLELQVRDGSPQLHRSMTGGLSWEPASKPFTSSQIASIEEEGFILMREPNTCFVIDTVWIRHPSSTKPIIRSVILPQIDGIMIDPAPGEYFVDSRDDFTFTVTPIGRNASRELTVATDRRLLPDNEGVSLVNVRDGSYVFTIHYIQEPVIISINLSGSTVSAEEIENGNAVWTDGRQLHITASEPGIATIYTLSGTAYRTISLYAGDSTVATLPDGVYIVSFNGKSYKAVIH